MGLVENGFFWSFSYVIFGLGRAKVMTVFGQIWDNSRKCRAEIESVGNFIIGQASKIGQREVV